MNNRQLYGCFIKRALSDQENALLGGASILGGGLLGKGYVDADVVYKHLQDADQDIARAATTDRFKPNIGTVYGGGKGQYTLSQAQEAADMYINKARDVGSRKILGIPSAHIIQGARNLHDYGVSYPWNKAKSILHPFSKYRAAARDAADHVGTDLLSRSKHYNLFANKSTDPRLLRGHMLEVAMESLNGGPSGMQNKFDDDVRKVLFGETTDSYAARLGKLVGHKDYADIKKSVIEALSGVGGDWHPDTAGLAERVLGSSKTPRYTQMYRFGGGKLLKYLKPLLGVGAIGLPALGATMLAKGTMNKSGSFFSQEQETEPNWRMPVGIAGIAGGALTMPGQYKNYKQTVFNPNLNIGVTYGTNPEIGAGHKEPANAILDSLRERINKARSDSWLKNVSIHDLPRDAKDAFPVNLPKLNTLVNTGGGYHGFRTSKFENEVFKTPLESQTMLNYLTDLPSERRTSVLSRNRAGATFADRLPGASNRMMTWGPDDMFRFNPVTANAARIGEGMTPAVGKDVLDILSKMGNPEDVRGYVANAINDPKHVLNTDSRFAGAADTLKSILDKTKDKQTIVVSGSGRGDYVATRARLLADEIRKNGLSDRVHVIAQLTKSEELFPELKPMLSGYDDVVTPIRGWMPKDLFVGVQNMGDIHMGSTGTSSLAEALASRNILAIPENWGWIDPNHTSNPRNVKITPGSYADEQNKLLRKIRPDYDEFAKRMVKAKAGPTASAHYLDWLKKYRTHANIDDWNMGNIDYALRQPGVLKANRVSDIIGLLKDPERLAQMRQQADTRGLSELDKIVKGRTQMVDAILDTAKKNVSKARWKALGRLGAAGGAIAGGAALLPYSMSPKEDKSWFSGELPWLTKLREKLS